MTIKPDIQLVTKTQKYSQEKRKRSQDEESEREVPPASLLANVT